MAEGKLKVLLAEDEAEVLEIMARHVTAAGFDVVTAVDGVAAEQAVRESDPDILVLDINMPLQDGFAILENLTERPAGIKWRPVIIISARGDAGSYRRGFELHADHYLAKPCSARELVDAVKRMADLLLIDRRGSAPE